MISNTPHVNPLLKKTYLPKEDLNYFISFNSKILEKVVASLQRLHISSNCLSDVSQPTYKQFHSTETADVTLNLDQDKVTALTLLDLFAAFDTRSQHSY